jgi:hypothetical protein
MFKGISGDYVVSMSSGEGETKGAKPRFKKVVHATGYRISCYQNGDQ